MTEASALADRITRAYTEAVAAADVDALVALYDPSVRVFDLWARWRYDGADEWRDAFDEWFGSLEPGEQVVVEFDDVVAHGGDGLASVHATIGYASQRDGAAVPERAMRNRLTWVLQRTADDADPLDPLAGWRIVHEHTSGPVDAETTKVILEPGA